jgi:hypothetical protein
VTSLRLWLILLLAVLLPLRGALAASMTCPVAGSGMKTGTQMAEQAHEHGHAHSHGTGVDHHGAELTSVTGDHHDVTGAGEASDKCNVCSAFCSVTGLVSGTAEVAKPQRLATVFPHPFAPPPSYFPDGQERPPRSI